MGVLLFVTATASGNSTPTGEKFRRFGVAPQLRLCHPSLGWLVTPCLRISSRRELTESRSG